ncbi:TrkH family potassium uptake protein [Jeotgalibaca caeni]|uniref:TrkH family potassium uptake protein n=1 Tax=Jeotgalibaca caeni TaxID=3028623 RepID=UPI00237D49E2|nr:potassium transporter TrkG [Jeotgalibaca caeni]MDE1548506.1 potassium transporter TrkG [Jeotgalibaca caeni]
MWKWFNKWNPSQKIVASFAVVIVIGFVFLSLPISQAPGSEATYFDHFFHSVSLVSVTGLVIHPVSTTYSTFGQVVTLFLMQVGGLGLMTLVASIVTAFGRKMALRNRLAVLEGINRDDSTDFRTFLKNIIRYVVVIEGVGFFLLSFRFVPDYGWGKGLFTALYLSVSGFTNGGFDNLGTNSLTAYVHDPLVNMVLSALIILGGIGFHVWFDVASISRKWHKHSGKKTFRYFFRNLSLHSRLAIIVSLLLIVSGTLLFLLVEYNNPDTIGPFSFGQKLLASFFQTVTMRTAGLTTIRFTEVYPFTVFSFILSMFIGGSPGSTAGGLKTTTFAMVVLLIYNELRGQKNVHIWNHTIPDQLVRSALVIFIIFLATFLGGTGILSILNPEVDFIVLMFEVISAITTVGMSANLTSSLEMTSHIALMILMFVGRIGPITLAESLARKDRETTNLTYKAGKIIIG